MDSRPNFLFIMTDQQRGDCLSAEGHPVLLTPNMDSIGAQGVRFSKAYSTCPSCIAARRSLLSGQFPATHGMVGYHDHVEWDAPLTLPGALRQAGYQTVHVGRSMHQHPPRKRYGYDTMVLQQDYHDWLRRQVPETGGWFASGVMHNDWTARPWQHDESLHMTNWTVNEALKFLERRDVTCPFFLVVSFISPHPPLIPPWHYMQRYLDMDLPEPVIGDWETLPTESGPGDPVSPSHIHLTGEKLRAARAAYYGLINHVDDQIRRLLNPVLGIDQMTGGNTVVVFVSDHGEMLGDHYGWRKSVPFEPSARVPLLIRAPRRFGLATGSVVEQAVCLEDIMPTLLDMAGVDIPPTVQGRSLLPLMRGQQVTWRSHLHLEHAPQHQTLCDGREKFIWWTRDGKEQFFDLTDDPEERHDLIHDPARAERIEFWRRQLIEELRDRPEGFSDGQRLIAGQPHHALMPHARPAAP